MTETPPTKASPENNNTSNATTPVSLKGWVRALMVLILIAFFVLMLMPIIQLWPSDNTPATTATLFFWKIAHLSAETRILLLVVFGGGLGAFVHAATSLVDYLGNQTFKPSWIPWYFMRPFIGSGLAVLFYLLIRGGLIAPNAGTSTAEAGDNDSTNITNVFQKNDSSGTTITADGVDSVEGFTRLETQHSTKPESLPPVNVYGIIAIACLAGLFSKQATDKLREVFENLFRVEKPVKRADKLGGDEEDDDDNPPAGGTGAGGNNPPAGDAGTGAGGANPPAGNAGEEGDATNNPPAGGAASGNDSGEGNGSTDAAAGNNANTGASTGSST
jgi:hypothetical protein